MHGIIPSRDVAAKPPVVHTASGPEWQRSVTLWNTQQVFDEELHVKRGLPYPRDAPEDADLRRAWICGLAFAFLEELDELHDALEEDNPDEETVDTLHFVLSLAEKLDMGPEDLGRFEERFAQAAGYADAYGHKDWRDLMFDVYPEYVKAIARLKGAHHKWWKNQPDSLPDLSKEQDALRTIDRLNLALASRVFPSAEAMYERYMSKVQENHDRQAGKVATRADYQVA